MSKVKFNIGNKSGLPTQSSSPNEFYCCQDTGEIYMSKSDLSLQKYSDVIILDTELEREMLFVPLSKFYYIIDSQTLYRFDGDDWNKLCSGTAPKQTKVINFQFFGLPNQLERITTSFPNNGVIKGIKAFCSQYGTQNTILKVQKISNIAFKTTGIWTDILSTNITIVNGTLYDDGNCVLGNTSVNSGDLFRISCVSGNAQNINVQIEIELI